MGVTLMRTSEEEKIVAIAKISGGNEDKEEQLTLDENEEVNNTNILNSEIEDEIAVVDDPQITE